MVIQFAVKAEIGSGGFHSHMLALGSYLPGAIPFPKTQDQAQTCGSQTTPRAVEIPGFVWVPLARGRWRIDWPPTNRGS
jgi:hypothetical protein